MFHKVKRMVMALGAVALVAACAPLPQEAPAPGLPDDAACGAPKLVSLVGQPVAELPASGDWTTLRVLYPGDPMTEDYSPGRLTVMVDAAGRIESLTCG